jgi:hypothetical protein
MDAIHHLFRGHNSPYSKRGGILILNFQPVKQLSLLFFRWKAQEEPGFELTKPSTGQGKHKATHPQLNTTQHNTTLHTTTLDDTRKHPEKLTTQHHKPEN